MSRPHFAFLSSILLEAQAFFVVPLSVSLVLVSFATFSPQKGQNFEEISNQLQSSHKTFFPSKMENKNGGKLQSMSAVAVADPREGPYLKVWPCHWGE